MCQRTIQTYPCGHLKETWAFCRRARLASVLKPGQPTPCADSTTTQAPPNLHDTCGSICLTRPFVCHRCGPRDGPAALVGWSCPRCAHVRCPDCPVWADCRCPDPLHRCAGVALAVPGAAERVCDTCRARGCAAAGPGSIAQAGAPSQQQQQKPHAGKFLERIDE